MLAFRLKLPEAADSDTLIYIDSRRPVDERTAEVVFGGPLSGIRLYAHISRQRPDFQGLVKQMEADKSSGILKADRTPVLIKIGAHEGYGSEPGYNLISELKEPRPGMVRWRDSGVAYALHGTPGERGTSLRQLTQIAESMYQPKRPDSDL